MKAGTAVRTLVVLVGTLALVTPSVRAEEQCLVPCQGDEDCAVLVAECLINSGRSREALELLKPLVQQNTGWHALARALGLAYWAEANPFWARRTLQRALAARPENCETLSWLAWVDLQQGHLDLAEQDLRQAGCPDSEISRSRWALLEATLAELRGAPGWERQALAKLNGLERVYPEDLDWWASLRRRLDPGLLPVVSARLDLFAGGTSNAVAASPLDTDERGPSSVLGRMDLWARGVWPFPGLARPTLELSASGTGLNAAASDLSFAQLGIRPGVLLGRGAVQVLLAYRLEALWLDRAASGGVFSEAHRAEIELQAGSLTAFLGAGHRRFQEQARSRIEFDGGLGGTLALHPRLRLMLAGLARGTFADAPYGAVGGTLLGALHLELGEGAQLVLGANLDLDYYPDSGGEVGATAFKTISKRFDLLPRFSASFWTPEFNGAKLGLVYQFVWRDSTADTKVKDYDYREHRAVVRLRWAFDWDPRTPDSSAELGHVALPLASGGGGGEDDGLGQDSIQDWIRQDQAERKGACGCGG